MVADVRGGHDCQPHQWIDGDICGICHERKPTGPTGTEPYFSASTGKTRPVGELAEGHILNAMRLELREMAAELQDRSARAGRDIPADVWVEAMQQRPRFALLLGEMERRGLSTHAPREYALTLRTTR